MVIGAQSCPSEAEDLCGVLNESHNRKRKRRRRGTDWRVSPDVSVAVRVLDSGHAAHRRRRAQGRRRSVVGRLRRQRHDRLPDGPLPAGERRRRNAEARGRPEARRDDADDDRRTEFHRGAPRRTERRQKLRSVAMRTIKMTNGTELLLDGDLLSVIESLYIEVTAKRELERTFEDMVREIQHLIEQMNDAERRQYLSESLFLNTVSYENERLGAYMRKLNKKK